MSVSTRNATVQTVIYVAVAGVFAGGAFLADYVTRPASLSGFEQIGERFYPNFDDPTSAAALRIAAWDEAKEKPKVFSVEQRDGQWRIPSHHNYPAEAKERLAETAVSLVGITREVLASQRDEDHARLGVVDPLEQDSNASYGWGKRITLFDASGEVLADYIIGGQVPDSEGVYHVRRPGESQTYRARLDVNVTTKFSDWIEPDLLKAGGTDFTELLVKKPAFKEVRKEVAPGLVGVMKVPDPAGDSALRLHKQDSDWKLDGLDESKEELESFKVSSITGALADLKITGVRPKPTFNGRSFLTPDLRVDLPESKSQQRDFVESFYKLQDELAERGFLLASQRDDPLKARLVSENGELLAATDEGIVYHLHFGNAIVGDDEAIEIGGGDASAGAKSSKESPKDNSESKPSNGKQEPKESGEAENGEKPSANDGEGESPDGSKESDAKAGKNRYLYLRVEFDPKYVGDEPAVPGKARGPDEPAVAPRPGDLDAYARDRKEYEENVAKTRRKVDDLNARFAEWYYVIAAEDFDNLRPNREQLVKATAGSKEEPKDGAKADPPQPRSNPAGEPAVEPKPEPSTESGSETSKPGAAQRKPVGAESAEPKKP